MVSSLSLELAALKSPWRITQIRLLYYILIIYQSKCIKYTTTIFVTFYYVFLKC